MKHNMHVLIISRSVLLRIRNVSDKVVEKIKTHILCSIIYKYFFTFYEKNTVQPDRPPMTVGRTRIAYWIHQFTNRNSEYVTLIAFPLRQ